MQTNKRRAPIRTHEGAKAKHISDLAALKRSVLSCMLWESGFYESGQTIAERIQSLSAKVKADQLRDLAIMARMQYKLRHVPLLLARELARNNTGRIVGDAIYSIINRADELAEYLSLYWKDGKQPISKQSKIGLARAFRKFDQYQIAKYNRDNAIKLRDVLFMVHAKPKDIEQAGIWRKLANKQLTPPDTWEVALSGGKDKKETFTRLLVNKKLGYMALLRNLRNMVESGVDYELIAQALKNGARKSKALPFRFVSAAKHAPSLFKEIDNAMKLSISGMERLPGKTIILVDVSASMNMSLSRKSGLSFMDAAGALASLVVGISGQTEVYSFSNQVVQVPTIEGMSIIDKIKKSQPNGGTMMGYAVTSVFNKEYDRLIVITDEQSHDTVPDPKHGKNYVINVASNRNGVGYGKWIHVDGFSEAVIDWIREYEKTYTE